MDSKVALDKIKETELKAEDIIEQAKRESQGILHNARLEKERILAQAKADAERDAEGVRVKIRQLAATDAANIEGQSKEAVRALKEKAQPNIDKALDFLREKLGL